MKTLLIYDKTGKIWVNSGGIYVAPTGIPFLEVEIPDGKRVVRIDVSVTPNIPIYEDLPIDPIVKLQADLDYIAMMTGVEL